MGKQVFMNILMNTPDNVTKMVCKPMFSWSRIKIKSFKTMPDGYILKKATQFMEYLMSCILLLGILIRIFHNIFPHCVRITTLFTSCTCTIYCARHAVSTAATTLRATRLAFSFTATADHINQVLRSRGFSVNNG
jgi:hypothetical protein